LKIVWYLAYSAELDNEMVRAGNPVWKCLSSREITIVTPCTF